MKSKKQSLRGIILILWSWQQMGVPSGRLLENDIALLISNVSLASVGTFEFVDVLFCWLVRLVRMQRTLADTKRIRLDKFVESKVLACIISCG